MSTHKPPQSAKIESRILENIRSNFPEYPCTLSDLRYPNKEFVVQFFQFILEELRISPTKLVHVSSFPLNYIFLWFAEIKGFKFIYC